MSVDPAVESGIMDLKVSAKTDINILLIGETGVGKSTLINALANYITYKEFNIAKKEELLVLISSESVATDKNGDFHVIKVGEKDKNEENDKSSTQFIKTYVFPIWNGQSKLRLIDTPGMGGVDQDNLNTDNILRYIGQLNVLHAILFVLKPNQPNSAKVFRYSMSHILSQLDKSASRNIIFVFTNTRETEYGPGDMINLLRNEIDNFSSTRPELVIPMNRNIFCFDNEPFRYLAGIKNSIQFDEVIEERNRENWKNSVGQCWQLISYIVGDKRKLTKSQPLPPHHIKSASAINEARRMIEQLKLPLVDMYQLISDNINSLERHQACIRLDNQSLEQLTNKMYIPTISLDITEREHPVIICTSRLCAEPYLVDGNNKWLYKPCQPSSLTMPPKEIIGIPRSELSTAGESSNCPKCGCNFGIHMHVYYLTKTKEDLADKKISSSSEELVENMKQILKDINDRKEELETERQFIITTCSKFSFFLQNNSISSFNDSLKEYIEYLINREKALGKLCNQQTITYLEEKFLKEYEEIKSTLQDVHRLNQKIGISEVSVTLKDISEFIQKLYKLKHSGKTLKQLYNCQKKARRHEYMNSEYSKKIEFKRDEKREARKKQENKKSDSGKNEEIEKEQVNDKKVIKNKTEKNEKKKEKDPKIQDEKGNLKEKGNKEEKKKDKDKKVPDKNNTKEGNKDKENNRKEQGAKANNKKEKSEDVKGKDEKSLRKEKVNDKKGKDRNTHEKRNEQVGGNRNRGPVQGTNSKNDVQRFGREVPPSYQEIYQNDSQLPRPGIHGPQPPQGYYPQPLGSQAPTQTGKPYGPSYSAQPYGPPGPPYSGGPYGPPYPGRSYGPPLPVGPFGSTTGADPYRSGIDYRYESPKEDILTYNFNIKLEKSADLPQPRPLLESYVPPPYFPSHGPQAGPPASQRYDSHPSTSSRGNSRARGGNRGSKFGGRGRGNSRGGSNRRKSEKKNNQKSEGKTSNSDSDDSDEYVIVE